MDSGPVPIGSVRAPLTFNGEHLDRQGQIGLEPIPSWYLIHGHFDFRGNAVFDDGLTLGDLAGGFFAAGFIEFLEAVEAVSRVTQNLTGLADVTQLSGQFEQTHSVLDDLLFRCHV